MQVTLKETERIDDLQLKGLKLIQDKTGFCFGIDAVLLANFAKVKNNAKVVAIPDKMDEYTTYGRKTEVVIAPGDSITLTLKDTTYNKVQLGARIDAAVPANITGGSADGKVLINSDNINIKSSTDMYYTVKVKDNGEIKITNNTNKLLALTKLKLIK